VVFVDGNKKLMVILRTGAETQLLKKGPFDATTTSTTQELLKVILHEAFCLLVFGR